MGKSQEDSSEEFIIRIEESKIHLEYEPHIIFTSLHSRYLETYENGIIQASEFDTDESLTGMSGGYGKNYRRYLGERRIHLGTSDLAGFLNPNYDLSFAFDVRELFSKPALVCEHESLFQLLAYGMDDVPVGKMFKSKEDYQPRDEVLVRELDLKQARHILTFSSEADETLARYPYLTEINRTNLSEKRQAAIDLYFK